MKIVYAPRFTRAYRKLPASIRTKAEVAEDVFRKNPFDSRLKTHKLSGGLANYWSFSVDVRYRVIFRFYRKDGVYFLLIGDHSIYEQVL